MDSIDWIMVSTIILLFLAAAMQHLPPGIPL
jgi:hypothetical protein